MKIAETPFLADLFAISFRWLILFGLITSLSLTGKLDNVNLSMIGMAAVWNVFNTTIASVNRRLPYHRQINLLADVLCTMLIFIASGGIAGPVLWVGALSVSSASIYFLLPGSLLIAILTSLLETAYVYYQTDGHFSLTFLVLMIGLNMTAGLITGLLSNPLIKRLRVSYQNILRQRREAEAKVQRAERERMKALFQITETMSGTLNYQTVLQTALDGSVTALGVSQAEGKNLLSAFLLFQDGKLKMVSARGFPPRDLNIALKGEAGGIHLAISSGNPQLIQDPNKDPELRNLVGLQDNPVVFCIPLIRGLNAFGVLVYAHPDPNFFLQDRRDILEMVSNQSLIAIQNARLFQDITTEKERIVSSQEEAQKKLARDLHDGPTQSVSAIAMRLAITRKLFVTNPREALEEIIKVEDLARRTTQEIRHMLFTLRPLILETEGLTAAIQTIADKMGELYQQNVKVDIDPRAADELDMSKSTVLFNLAEEAINNARKHAAASEVVVRLKYVQNEPHIAVLEVIDNGKGFDVKEVMGSYERRGSLGMVNLRERTDLINGLLKIDSELGKGTRIRVFIPLDQDAVDRLHRVH